jgi:hypothetical protein
MAGQDNYFSRTQFLWVDFLQPVVPTVMPFNLFAQSFFNRPGHTKYANEIMRIFRKFYRDPQSGVVARSPYNLGKQDPRVPGYHMELIGNPPWLLPRGRVCNNCDSIIWAGTTSCQVCGSSDIRIESEAAVFVDQHNSVFDAMLH